jgi:phage shock protein C
MSEQQRRLYRSQTNKVIAGVCGGLGEYLNIDTTVIRLSWILLTFLGGSGVLVYIIAYFIMPQRPEEPGTVISSIQSDFTAARIFGLIFVATGAIILLDNLDILSFHRWWHMSSDFVLPGLLIIIGIYFLSRRGRIITTPPVEQATEAKPEQSTETQEQTPPKSTNEKSAPKTFRRSVTNKKMLGICGGAGEYFDIDPTIVRIGYVAFTLISGGLGFILYLVLYLIIPEGKIESGKQ